MIFRQHMKHVFVIFTVVVAVAMAILWSRTLSVRSGNHSSRLWYPHSGPYSLSDANNYWCDMPLFPNVGIVSIPVSDYPNSISAEQAVIVRSIEELRRDFLYSFEHDNVLTLEGGETVKLRPKVIVFLLPKKSKEAASRVAYALRAADAFGKMSARSCVTLACRSEDGWTFDPGVESRYRLPILDECKTLRINE